MNSRSRFPSLVMVCGGSLRTSINKAKSYGRPIWSPSGYIHSSRHQSWPMVGQDMHFRQADVDRWECTSTLHVDFTMGRSVWQTSDLNFIAGCTLTLSSALHQAAVVVTVFVISIPGSIFKHLRWGWRGPIEYKRSTQPILDDAPVGDLGRRQLDYTQRWTLTLYLHAATTKVATASVPQQTIIHIRAIRPTAGLSAADQLASRIPRL